MSTIVKRSQLDRPLTCEEYDNNLDATLARSNHTGTQLSSTISDLKQVVEAYDFIVTLKACCTDLTTQITQLQESLFGDGELNTIVNNLRQELLQDIAELTTDLDALTVRVNNVEATVSTFNTTISTLSSQVSSLVSTKADINSPTFTGTPRVPQPLASSNDDQIATTAFVKSFGLPIGVVLPYGGNSLPDDTFMFAQGQAVSRTTYSILFARFGTTYGAGDGATTFNLPNLNYRVPMGPGVSSVQSYTLGQTGGEERHTMTENELVFHGHSASLSNLTVNLNDPGHSHRVYAFTNGSQDNSDHFSHSNTGVAGERDGTKGYIATNGGGTKIIENSQTGITVSSASGNVSIAGSGNSQPFNVMQPYLVLNFIVKVK